MTALGLTQLQRKKQSAVCEHNEDYGIDQQADVSFGIMAALAVPHIFTRKSRLQPGEFLITSAKRLLQQYRHECACRLVPVTAASEYNADGICRGDFLRERMRLTRFSRLTRRIGSLQSVGNLRVATASDIEGPTDLDWVGLCFETEISRCALNSCMAQERSNCLQIASAFQNVESLRPA